MTTRFPTDLFRLVLLTSCLVLLPASARAQEALALLQGQVRDAETGLPLEARIHVGNVEIRDPLRLGHRSIRTGPAGQYLILAPAGETVLTAGARGYSFARQTVQARPAQVLTGLDFELEKGLILPGTVVNPQGHPVAGARIRLINPDPEGRDRKSLILLDQLAETWTDGRGEFNLAPVPTRTDFLVEASRTGHLPQLTPPLWLDPGQTPERIRIVLSAGWSVSGIVVDEEGDPVAGARILLPRKNAGWMPPMGYSIEWLKRQSPRTTSNRRGEFSLEGIGGGDAILMVTHPAHSPSVQRLILSGSDEADGEVHLRITLSRDLPVEEP